MKRKKNKISIYMLLGIVYTVLILTISTAYSFFNEDLSINATASLVKKEKNYKVDITEISKNSYNNLVYYEYNIVITYLGTETTTGWEAYIKVPYTVQVEGCYNGICSVNGEVLTVKNAEYNASLSPNNTSTSFNLKLAMEENDYSLDVLDVLFKTNSITPDPDPNPNPDPDPDPNPDPDPDPNPGPSVDYITATYEMKNDWGTRQWHVLNIENTSTTETITSWTVTFKVTSTETMNNANIWGGDYKYDEENGIITVTGPSWSPTLPPSGKVEVNLQISPPAPEAISFVGITSSGEKVTATIK